MATRMICDICGEIIWADGDGLSELGLYEINDICDECYEKLGKYAQKLKKEKGFYKEDKEFEMC